MTVETPRDLSGALRALDVFETLARRWSGAVHGRLGEWAAVEAPTVGYWAPVAIGAGAAFYFGLKSEPSTWWAVVFMAASGFAVWKSRSLRVVACAAFFCAIGFIAADIRTAAVSAPVLKKELAIGVISGRLVSVEEGASRRRLLIEPATIEGLGPAEAPKRIRVNWKGAEFSVAPGDIITLRAGLSPPPPPAAPGAYDFARHLYFQGIGAVGYAVSAPQLVTRQSEADRSLAVEFSAGVEAMRLHVFRRITSAASGDGAAIVAAIVTGKREAISARAEAALRDTGLAHLLAISGLHMGLATGLVFFTVRFGLALIEPVALRYPIKKWAALAALASGFFYLLLSGGGWSARRAFIMAAIMMTAVLADRRALSLRNVAIAATLILLTTPEAVFHPGFQMSFAAVTALIAAYEWIGEKTAYGQKIDASLYGDGDANRAQAGRTGFRSLFNRTADEKGSVRIVRYLVYLGVTDTICAIATAPYALFHFNRVALFSLPANMAAMPLMGFWIVPAAVVGLVLAPLGLDGPVWRFAAAGMEVVLWVAQGVAAWPGAVSITPQWPISAMLALTLGGLFLCLMRAPWRLGGLVAIPVAALMVALNQSPQIFVANSGLNAAIAVAGGEELAVFSRRRDRFDASLWKEAIGLDPEIASSVRMKEHGRCDKRGCVVRYAEESTGEDRLISFLNDSQALQEDCARADLVVAFFPVSGGDWRACRAVLIDRRSIWRRGAHAVYLNDGVIRVKTVSETRGLRPWTDGSP